MTGLRSLWRPLIAFPAVAVVFGLRLLLAPVLPGASPYALCIAAVLASGWAGGLAGGLLATVLVVPLGSLLFLYPATTLTAGTLVPAALFLAEGVLASALAGGLWRVRTRAMVAQQLAHQQASQLLVQTAELEGSTTQVRAHEARIRALEEQLELGEGRRRECERQLNARDVQIQACEAQIEERDARLQERAARLAEIEARLYAAEEAVQARAAETRVVAEQLEASRAELREARAALELRDELVAVSSREIKAPLALVLGNANLVSRRAAHSGTLGDDDLARLESMAQQVQRVTRTVDGLLDLALLLSGQLVLVQAPFDLRAMVTRVVDALRPLDPQRAFATSVPPEPLPVYGDEPRLEQAVLQLVRNAIIYSPADGPVGVRLVRDGPEARLAISDVGIGIPAAALPHLFDHFYRAPNAETAGYRGSGVGLYVAQQIVARHRGRIEVISEEGHGSVFTVHLPLAS